MKTSNNNGIGFFGVLTIVFIVLKLCDLIKWSWVCVLMPLWFPLAIALICLFIQIFLLEL